MSETVSRRDSPSEAAAASTGRRVLVVDDHPDVRAMFSLALSQAGMRVLTASDGHDALELIERDLQQAQEAGRRPTVALIVLDLMMPDVNGFDVVEALQQRSETAVIPIIVVTANQITPEDRAKLNGFVATIMEKGEFDRARFTTEVRRAMSGRRAAD